MDDDRQTWEMWRPAVVGLTLVLCGLLVGVAVSKEEWWLLLPGWGLFLVWIVLVRVP